MQTQVYGLALLRILMGVFFLFDGIGKLAWLTAPGLLTARLTGYSQTATAFNQWYLDLAMPWAVVLARVVTVGELAAGLALLTGMATRTAAALALVGVLNMHVASGALFHYAFLTNSYGPPVVGALAALALSGKRLPWSMRG